MTATRQIVACTAQPTLRGDDRIDGQGPHKLRMERVISLLSRNLIRCPRNAAPRREKIVARELGRWWTNEQRNEANR